MSTVSVLILTRNEEKHIRDCIESCLPVADEVIVIDDGSTDQTVAIAEELGSKVVQHALNRDWAQQRMFAISQATCDWILFVDADERISSELAQEIRHVIDIGVKQSFTIQRENVFHHNRATHGVLRPDRVLRLMPRDGVTVTGAVHETIASIYPTEPSKGVMYHYTFDSWEQYFNKLNSYTTVAAENYRKSNKPVSFVKDILFRPFWAFLKMYLLQGGFLDGKMGWILSVNHYVYTMMKYVKLYHLYKSNGKL